MMKWLTALLILAGASFFLYNQFHEQVVAPPPPIAVPPAVNNTDPGPLLSADELRAIKKSAMDPDATVRWSALQLLFAFHDPDSVKLLEQAIAQDPDADIRMKAIQLLRSADNVDRIPGLVRGLSDTDRNVRLASLKALGDVADPSATPWVVDQLKDPDPDIRVAALQTLSKFEDKRKKDFQELAKHLREQYEEAIKKAGKRPQTEGTEWKLE